jgi:hypothetical protein
MAPLAPLEARFRCDLVQYFSQRMEPAPGSLWDFVSHPPFRPIRYVSMVTKFFRINYLHHNSIPLCRWHIVCSLVPQLTRLASRGGRNRTSTRCLVLGCQLEKGGLHQPPFSIYVQSPRECVVEVVLVVVVVNLGAGLGSPFLFITSLANCRSRILSGMMLLKK